MPALSWENLFQQGGFGFFNCILFSLGFFSGRMTHPHPKETHLCLWKVENPGRQALMGHRWQTSAHFTAYMHYVVLALDHPLHLISYAFLYYPLSWPTSFFLSPTRSFIILSQQQCQEPRLNGLFQDPFGSTSIKTLPAQWVISAGVEGEYVSPVMERLSWVQTQVW